MATVLTRKTNNSRYDLNGSVTAIQDGPFETETTHGKAVIHDLGNDTYSTEGGWALNEPKPGAGTGSAKKPQKEYRWDDRNRLEYSADGRYNVYYTYGEDGERTGKWALANTGGESETLYFGKLWSWHYDGIAGDYTGTNSKHIFVGETRIATKVVYADGSFIQTAEEERQYYYHSDHLGSAQLITDYKGDEYERLEYTPYGELWIEKASAASALDVAYRFTGKERDKETGLYYYGARYLDPRDSRWLSVDPALGEYVPEAPVDDEARKRNGKLPGMGGVFNYVNLHVYHYAGNNPVKYTDPDGNDYRSFCRGLVFLLVNVFGGPVTKAMYNASLNGSLQDVNATPQNDTYGLSTALKKEVNNITIGGVGLLKQISNKMSKGEFEGSAPNDVKVGKYGGSDLAFTIGGIENLEWNKIHEDEEGTITINVTIKDTFNFEKRNRGGLGEFLTGLGRDGELKEAKITASFTLQFRKKEDGNYEYIK
jgi:RHS repeat-associated protein